MKQVIAISLVIFVFLYAGASAFLAPNMIPQQTTIAEPEVQLEPTTLPVPLEAEVEIETKVTEPVIAPTRWQAFKNMISNTAGAAGTSTAVGAAVTAGTVIAGLLVYWLIILLL